MWEDIREAFDGIRSHKLRSALTMLGIVIGIASLIAISSTILGTNEQIKENLIGAGNNTVTVTLYQGEYPFEAAYNALPEGVPVFEESDVKELCALSGVTGAARYTRRDAYGSVYSRGGALSGGTVYGIDGHYLKVAGYAVYRGRLINEEDTAFFRKVALLDRTAAENLFGSDNPVGQTVEIGNEPFVVIGEIEKKSSFQPVITSINEYYTYADTGAGSVFIPIETWPVVYAYDEPVSILLQAKNTDAMTGAGKQAADLLNEKLQSADKVRYQAEDLLEQARQLQELSGSTNKQLLFVAAISLLVGGIGVMNIMLVSVTERTAEIGLKKALGAGKRRISAQFLIEAGVLTTIGGVIGVLAGFGLAVAISKLSGVPVFINAYIVILTVVFSCAVGIVCGALPAHRAANMNPIDALRHE